MQEQDDTGDEPSKAADTTNISKSEVWKRRRWITIAFLTGNSVWLLVWSSLLIEGYISSRSALKLLECIVWLAATVVWIAENIFKLVSRQRTQECVNTNEASIKTANTTTISRQSSNLQRNCYWIIIGIIVFLAVHLVFYSLVFTGYKAGYIGNNPALEPLEEIAWVVIGAGGFVLGIATLIGRQRKRFSNILNWISLVLAVLGYLLGVLYAVNQV